MIIKQITVSDSRQLMDGSWKKIEWVAELDEKDIPEHATMEVKKRIDETFKIMCNPHLYQEQESTIREAVFNDGIVKYTQQDLNEYREQQKISPEQEIADILKGIEESTAENLHTWILLAAKNKKTMGAFNKRKKQLNIS